MENPKHSSALVLYEKKLYAEQITTELRNRWGCTEDEATLRFRELRNAIRIDKSYEKKRFEAYTSDFAFKRLSFVELIQHIAVLALYTRALTSNRLKKGRLTQEWNLADGWHPALNRMYMVAHTPKYTVSGPDLCTLVEKLHKPEELLIRFFDMFNFYCNSLATPHSEGISSIACPTPDGQISLGRRNGHEIVFLYEAKATQCRFSLTLTPRFTVGIPRRFQGTYRLGIQWNTGAATPLENFAIEELIAKCIPFGPMELDLPLLTAQAQRTA